MDEINDATDRVIAGLEGRALQDNAAKKLIAYHEAGHAIVGTLLPFLGLWSMLFDVVFALCRQRFLQGRPLQFCRSW